MSLALEVVDQIHTALLVRYGSRWASMWAGAPIDAIKADWSEQLSGATPAGVQHALRNLPVDFPPNVAQFRELANRAPVYQPPALPLPKPDPAGMKRVAAQVAKARPSEGMTLAQHAEVCFSRLYELKKRGALSAAQRDFLKRAEAGKGAAMQVQEIGDFKPIPFDALPPGMRAEAAQRDADSSFI